jgi:phosphate transport system permease protein
MKISKAWQEKTINSLIILTGYSTIIFVLMILTFLLISGLPTIGEVNLVNLLGRRWYPIESYYGLLPLIAGSLVITIGTTLIAVPIGVGTAIFIAEVAPQWARNILKPIVELLGGVPSVILGFLGILFFSDFIRRTFLLPTGLTAFTGALLLAAVSIPAIVSISEDALDSVPRAYRDAAIAIGATRWQTIWMVTVPAARSGILTAIMLGIGRTIGETMVVLMVTGNAAVMPTGLSSLFAPVRTMTATIAAEMGEVANGSVHYHVLFFIGIVLFFISMLINLAASAVIFRQRKRSERLLS